MTHCCKRQLTSRLFDFVADGEVDIFTFKAEIFAKKAEVSCATPTASNNQVKYPKNSHGKKPLLNLVMGKSIRLTDEERTKVKLRKRISHFKKIIRGLKRYAYCHHLRPKLLLLFKHT